MIITYENTDITPLVTVSKCVYEAREEGRLPQLVIWFSDGKGIIDSWNPKCGDSVTVTEDGAPSTGEMFVRSCEPKAGGYIVRADALPKPDARATRVWRNTTLYVVAAQIAADLGCKISLQGVSDMGLKYVRQNDEPSLALLARLCTFAGCIFDVYDRTIYLCGRSWMESQQSAGTLNVPARFDYSYRRDTAYTACRIRQSEIYGCREKITASSGSAGRELSIMLDDSIGFPGSSELKRACSGVLACVNARSEGGFANARKLSPFSPGTVCTVKCKQSTSLSGNAIVTRVRNNYVSGNSKTWWRMLK